MIVGNVKHLDVVDDQKHLSSVKSNFIDTEIFQDALADTRDMKGTIEERNEEQPFFKKLSEDLFNALYKPRPEVYNKQNVAESLQMENDLVNELINNEKFNKLRRNTAGDIFNSTFSLNTFQEQAYQHIQAWVQESKENQDLMDQMNNTIEQQEELMKMLENLQYDPSNQDLQQQAQQLQQMIDQGNQQIGQKQAQQRAQGKTPNTADLKSGLNDALDQTQQQTQQMDDAFKNFFGDGDANDGGGAGQGKGALSRVPYDERKRLSDALLSNSTLKEIAKKLGRMKQLLGDLNKKPSQYGHSIADVGTGNMVNRTLASEKMLLAEPALENEFYKKYLDKTLLQYETKGLEEMKGPIVVCVDDSGSMHGNRDYWAKAIALAMLQLAMKDKRAYRCIIFSDGVDAIFDFDKDHFSADDMIKMAEFFASGGTEFEPALVKAVESIEESRFKKADILFITDGDPYGNLTPDFKARYKATKEEKGFKCQGIIIGNGGSRYLDEFCDSVTNITDLNKDGELSNIFKNIKDGDDSDN